MDLSNYDFVLADWQPAAGTLLTSSWRRTVFNGLPYINFSASVRQGEVFTVVVRVDPCSCLAAARPYTIMVQADLELALQKALRQQRYRASLARC